jgi:hypothetical protein
MWYKRDPAIPGSAFLPLEMPWKISHNKRFAPSKSSFAIAGKA